MKLLLIGVPIASTSLIVGGVARIVVADDQTSTVRGGVTESLSQWDES